MSPIVYSVFKVGSGQWTRHSIIEVFGAQCGVATLTIVLFHLLSFGVSGANKNNVDERCEDDLTNFATHFHNFPLALLFAL
jgi:hypothetical protein